MDWLALVSRWAHVGSAILLVGGSAFLLLVLAPAADRLGEAEHNALRGHLTARWRRFVHPLVFLLLLSGAYNFYARMNTERPWHMVAGIKVLLGIVVIFLASALVGRSQGLQKLRDNWRFWLKVNLIVAAIVVMLSGYLRFLQPKPTGEVPDARQRAYFDRVLETTASRQVSLLSP